jgi:hypothetical protein
MSARPTFGQVTGGGIFEGQGRSRADAAAVAAGDVPTREIETTPRGASEVVGGPAVAALVSFPVRNQCGGAG